MQRVTIQQRQHPAIDPWSNPQPLFCLPSVCSTLQRADWTGGTDEGKANQTEHELGGWRLEALHDPLLPTAMNGERP